MGIAGVVLGAILYRAVERQSGPSAADRRLVAARVVAAVKLPSSCCKRTLHTTCTATDWSVCLVTVYVPEPLDACEDWSVSVHDHFVTGPRYLQTRVCS